MPSARDLLEQADALMRSHRNRGASGPDTVPVLTDVAIPGNAGFTRQRFETIPALKHTGGDDADALAPTPAQEALSEMRVPELDSVSLQPSALTLPPLPAMAEPANDQPTIRESVIDEPVTDEPPLVEAAIDESSRREPTRDEPTLDEPTLDEPTLDEPPLDEALDRTTLRETTLEERTLDEPPIDRAMIGNSAAAEPTKRSDRRFEAFGPAMDALNEAISGMGSSIGEGRTRASSFPERAPVLRAETEARIDRLIEPVEPPERIAEPMPKWLEADLLEPKHDEQPVQASGPAPEEVAETVYFQVLQNLDLYTERALQRHLTAHLTPIIEQATRELLETLNANLGAVMRQFVADAIERQLGVRPAGGDPHEG